MLMIAYSYDFCLYGCILAIVTISLIFSFKFNFKKYISTTHNLLTL